MRGRPRSGLGREQLFTGIRSGHSGLSGAEGLLTARLPPDTELLPNGRIGREARIADPAAFRVERPVERPLPEQADSLFLAGSTNTT